MLDNELVQVPVAFLVGFFQAALLSLSVLNVITRRQSPTGTKMTKIGLFWNYLSLLHISEGRLFLVNSSGKKEQCTKEKMKHCVLLLPPFSDFFELFFFTLHYWLGTV